MSRPRAYADGVRPSLSASVLDRAPRARRAMLAAVVAVTTGSCSPGAGTPTAMAISASPAAIAAVVPQPTEADTAVTSIPVRVDGLDVGYSATTGPVLLGRTCDETRGTCETWIRVSVDDGRSFPPAAQRKAFLTTLDQAADAPATLELVGQSVRIYSATQEHVSTDLGKTWRVMPARARAAVTSARLPCQSDATTVAARGAVRWVACQQQESPPASPFSVFVSEDRGRSWTPRPDAPALRYRAELTVLGSRTAVLYNLGRSPLLQTDDGGSTWRTVAPFRENGYGPVIETRSGVLALVRFAEWNPTGIGLLRRGAAGWTRISVRL